MSFIQDANSLRASELARDPVPMMNASVQSLARANFTSQMTTLCNEKCEKSTATVSKGLKATASLFSLAIVLRSSHNS